MPDYLDSFLDTKPEEQDGLDAFLYAKPDKPDEIDQFLDSPTPTTLTPQPGVPPETPLAPSLTPTPEELFAAQTAAPEEFAQEVGGLKEPLWSPADIPADILAGGITGKMLGKGVVKPALQRLGWGTAISGAMAGVEELTDSQIATALTPIAIIAARHGLTIAAQKAGPKASKFATQAFRKQFKRLVKARKLPISDEEIDIRGDQIERYLNLKTGWKGKAKDLWQILKRSREAGKAATREMKGGARPLPKAPAAPITPPQVRPVAPPGATPPPASLPPPTGIQPSVAPAGAAVRAVVQPTIAKESWQMNKEEFQEELNNARFLFHGGADVATLKGQSLLFSPTGKKGVWLSAGNSMRAGTQYLVDTAKLDPSKLHPAEGAGTGYFYEGEISSDKFIKLNERITHKGLAQQALAQGKPIPPEALADYPDLQSKVPAKPTPIPRPGPEIPLAEEKGFKLVGKPRAGVTLKGNLIKQSHVIAKEKGWISKEGKVKPQYRRLAEAMTGNKSIANMNPKQAQTFVDALKQVPAPEYVAGKTKIASIPLSKDITPAGFFERNFKEPTLISAITPSDRYAYTLGVHDLIEPSIKGKTALLNERQGLHDWLDGMEKKTNKLAKTPVLEKSKARLKNIPTKAEERMGTLVDNYETAAEAGLTGEEAIIHTELRKLTNVSLARTNEIREAVGLEPIRKLSGYMTHISDILSNKVLKEKYPFPEEIKYWLDRINPKHIFNPTALHRTVKDRPGLEKNPFKALKAMVSMDLKQIYLEAPNIMFRKQLNALAPQIPATTRKWAQAFQNEVIKGYPTRLDNLTNATLDRMGITRMIDAALKPFGRGLGANPAKEISGAINRLVHDAVIWGKVRLVIRNHTQKLLSLGLYDTKAFMKSMLPASPELESILKGSEWFKLSGQQFMERLPEGMLGKLEKLGYKPYGHSHVSNVRSTMKAAYYASKELVDNPKYKRLGWAEADIKKEMEFGGNTAQFWYNLMGMPEIFRSGGGRFLSTLQSWWMNYTTKYWREMLHRAYYGKTGWGKSIPVKWRMGALRHVITSLLFVEGTRRALGLDYKRIALLGVLPTYLSPPAQIVTGLYNYVAADSDWQKKKALQRIKWSWKAFVPGSGAWRDFSSVWEGEKPVESLFFYTEKKPPGKRKIGGVPTTVKYGP